MDLLGATSVRSRLATSAPVPTGAPILWPVIVITSSPQSRKHTGTLPRAATASEWTGT